MSVSPPIEHFMPTAMPPEPVCRLTVSQYHEMIAAGILTSDDPVVADASLSRDRSIKKQIYARAGIPVYWIVNLPERRIEVYADPSGPGEFPEYRQHADYAAGEVPLVIEGCSVGRIAVAALLPAEG
jgi:hypothetical protein